MTFVAPASDLASEANPRSIASTHFQSEPSSAESGRRKILVRSAWLSQYSGDAGSGDSPSIVFTASGPDRRA